MAEGLSKGLTGVSGVAGKKTHSSKGTANLSDSMRSAPQRKFLSQLKEITINSLLLLVPSFIFIVVKINTADNTVVWRPENIPIFFGIYFVILSVFTFRPQQILIKSRGYKLLSSGVVATINRIRNNVYMLCTLGVIILVLPWFVSLYQVKVFVFVFTFLIFALGLNYTVGFAGVLNLGHVLPFAAGAYTYGLLYKYIGLGFYGGLIIGTVGGVLAGFLISIITIRLNGDYLAIVTLALAEIFKLIATNMDGITGGARGIPGIPLPDLRGIELSFGQRYILLYYTALGLAVLSIIVALRLVRSRFGRSWEAMREDKIAAVSMGIDLKKVRMIIFTIGGLFAGIAGVLQASSATYISPSISAILFSITVLSIVVLGGMGSIRGIILGTLVVVLLPEYLRTFSAYRMLIYGALLVVMMRYRQRGLLPQRRVKYLHYMYSEYDMGNVEHKSERKGGKNA